MKKIVTSFIAATMLTTVANADFLRVEMGAGGWSQTPSGYITRTDNDGALSLNGTYTSNENKSTQMYIWALIKHPVPIIPNLRLEYVNLDDDGIITGSVNGITVSGLGAKATIKANQYDVVPYYNIIDNTFWITLDLGLDIRYIQSDTNVVDNLGAGATLYNGSDSAVIPLLYARGRVQIPATGLGLESDIKYITDGDSTVYDFRAKIDYTFDFFPVVQPGVEVGYRAQKYDIVDGNNKAKLDYKGVYAGVMLRF